MPGMPGSPTDIVSFGSGIHDSSGTNPPAVTADYTLVQSARDTFTLTYTSAFLKRYEYGSANIGAAIKLYSTDGRKFNRIYKFDLYANTAPVLEYAGIGKTTVGTDDYYVLIFRAKDMDTMIGSPGESVHKDIDTMNVTAGGVSLSPITLSVTGTEFTSSSADLLAPLAVQKLKSTDPDISGSGLLRLKTDVKVGGPTKRYAVSVKDTQGLRSNLIEANTDTTRLDPVKLFDDSSVSAAQITGTTAGAPKVFADMNGKNLEARVSPDGVGITGKIYKKNGGNWTETDTVNGTTTAAINLPALGSSEEAVYKITLKAHLTGYDDSDETEFYVNLLRLEPPVLKIRQNFAAGNAALHSISAGSAGYVSEDIIPDADSYVAATPLVIYNAAGKVELSLTVPAGVTAKYKVGSGSEQSGSSIALNAPGPYSLKVWAEKGGAAIDSPEFHIQVINSVDTYERLKNLVQNTPARGTGQGQYNYSNSIDIKIGGDLSASSADTEIAVTGGKKLELTTLPSGTVRIIDANNSGRIFKISGSNSELGLLNIKLTGGDAADGKGGAVCVEAGGTLDLFGSTVITLSTGSDINTQGKNDVYLANGTSIKLDATLLGAAPIARITPQVYNNGNTVLTGTYVGSQYQRFSVTQLTDSERVWKIGNSGRLISFSSVINGTDPDAWKNLKDAVQSSPEGSIITINGEIKATNDLNNSGEIVINGTVTIKGKTGAGSDILNANSTGTNAPTTKHRIFNVQSGKTLMLENLTLTDGKVSGAGEAGFGGAIFVKGGALTMKNCTLTDNTATRGGGIAFVDGEGMTLTNCKIKENEVTNGDGGGISFETGTYTSEYTITGGEISENKVIMTDSVNQYSGGGIAVGNLGINITIDGCTIKDNRIRGASGKNPRGAGMWFGLGVNCTIKGNTTIENNKAHETGNEANLIGQGGGIQVDSGTLRIEDNTEIIGNGAKSGGGIYVQGGVITLIGSAVVTPSSGSDEDKPGKNDVYLGNGRTIKIVDILTGTAPVARITVPDANYAVTTQVLEGDIRYGQPKNYTKFTVTPKGSQKWEVDMDGFLQKTPVVINGSDSGAWQKLKAAVAAAAAGDTITVRGSVKATNASGNFGEIEINKNLTIRGETGAGSDILDANSGNLGSNARRIFWVNSGTLKLNGLTLKGGKAPAAAHGGGVYVGNSGAAELSDCVIENCTASRGGGIGASGNVKLTNTSIKTCEAASTFKCGGAVYAKGCTVELEGCTLTGNKANDGGAIYVYGAIVNITNCTLTRNTAEKNGGAVYAVKDGGAVSTVTIKGGTIGGTGTDANKVTDPYGFGGGIYINDDCTLKLDKYMGNGVRIIGNKAGRAGGVRANNSTVIMTGCTFSGNSATDSTPLGGGGGVYTHKGTLSMTNCTLTHNMAIKGGGVILEGTNTTMSNCTLTRNEAENGGAIYVKKTDDGIASNVIIAGGTIGGTAGTDANKATGSNGSGGGIYVGEHCGLNLQDSTGTGAQGLRIIGNQAAKGKGVYATNTVVAMKDRTQIDVNNDVYLDSGSKIRADSVLNPPGGTAACITVPDDKYNTGTQVLLAGTGVTLANEAGKFTVTPKIVGGTTQQWQVNNTGYLQPK